MKKILMVVITILMFSINAFADQASFKVVNIMEDFSKFWKQAEQQDTSTKIKLFREMVINPHKEVFAGFTGEKTDEEIAEYIRLISPLVPKLEKVTKKLEKDLPEQVKKFKQTFPDLNWKGIVVFMPNYGTTDSGTGTIGSTQYLIFGVDTIVSVHGEDANLGTLFSHELFHLYHSQFASKGEAKNRNKGETPLYSLVWGEGLATYASKKLNPEATSEQVFLSKVLEKNASPILSELAKKIRENFNAGEPEIWQPFMSGEDTINGIPGRSGYYIGYKIAEKLGKKMSLRTLAKLKNEDLQKKMVTILTELEKNSKSTK